MPHSFHAAAPIGPRAEEVRRWFLAQLSTGAWRPGQRTGGERELAAELGVSRSSVRRALAALEADGVVRRVPGRGGGTFVAADKVERDLSRIVGVPALLRDQGFTAGSRLLSAAVVTADEPTAAALGLASQALVYDVVRIRLADGLPISLEHARLPAERFPDLLEQPLSGSLYELLERRFDSAPVEAEERIEVVPATADEARILAVEPGSPLLSIVRTSRAADGTAIEHSHDLFRADRTTITVRTTGRGGAAGADSPAGTLLELRTGTR